MRTKTHAVCDRLTELAEQLGPDQKFPTFTELRNQMGVSVVTLSSALDELEAQQVLYRRPGVGIFVSPKFGVKSIALVCEPGFFQLVGTSPFWDILLKKTQERASALHWEVHYHFANTDDNNVTLLHRNLLSDIQGGRVHGLLSIGGGEQAYSMLEGADVPFVAYAGEGPYVVVMEPDGGVSTGAKMLVEAGCRRIAFWSPVMPYRVVGDPAHDLALRNAAASATLTSFHLPFYPELVERNFDLITDPNNRRQTELSLVEQGYQTAYRVFRRENFVLPDGIVSCNDMFTQGMMAAFRELGVCLNAQVRVASHANKGSSALLGVEKDLYLFEVDPAEIVQAMFTLLEAQMNGIEPASRRYIVTTTPRHGQNVSA
jgi:DNA-binding LacI/PurR family transcriptional regulator